MWKEKEYLLITQSFPHSPQVFPQELSTASTVCGYAEKVHIKVIDPLRGISHFSGAVDFAMGKIFVRNSHLDKGAGIRKTGRAALRKGTKAPPRPAIFGARRFQRKKTEKKT